VHVRRTLERAEASLADRRLDAEYVVEVGDPAERLLAVAEENESDVIVVGHHRHGLLERLTSSAVDEAVSGRTGRDVLLVH
jgi:nucleotide-binding universal stress UspA family protein